MEYIEAEEDTSKISFSGFSYLFTKGRCSTEENFAEEHYFTTDKKNISYFNFYPNSRPDFIWEAYLYGLLALVYPSNNLLEISKFPIQFRKAVKSYKKNCLKDTDKEIYLKFQGTVMFWDKDDEPVIPYCYVQIWTVKERIYSPSQPKESKLEKNDLHQLAEQKLIVLIDRLFSIEKDDKIKVNHASTNCLATSHSHQRMSEEDWTKVQIFRRQLIQKHVFGYQYPSTCDKVKRAMIQKGISLECVECKPTKEDPATTSKEEEDKMSKAAGKAKVEN